MKKKYPIWVKIVATALCGGFLVYSSIFAFWLFHVLGKSKIAEFEFGAEYRIVLFSQSDIDTQSIYYQAYHNGSRLFKEPKYIYGFPYDPELSEKRFRFEVSADGKVATIYDTRYDNIHYEDEVVLVHAF